MRAFWLAGSMAWAVVLGVWTVLPGGESPWWPLLAEIRFNGLSLALVGQALWTLVRAMLPFVVLGLLCRMAFGGAGVRPVGLASMLAVPAGLVWSCGLGLLLAGLGTGARWRAPGAMEAFLPLLGCCMGVVLAGAFRRPLRAVASGLLARMLLLGATIVLACLALGVFALGAGDSTALPAVIASDEKRALVDELRTRNPLRLAPGEQAVLVLAPEQLQSLLAWGVLLIDPQARVELRRADKGLAWEAALRLPVGPGSHRPVVLQGELALAVKDGSLSVDRCRIVAGRLTLPLWLCRSLLGSLYGASFRDADFGPLLGALEWLRVDETGLAARYTRPDLDPGTLRRLQFAFGPARAVRAAAAAQFGLLRARAPDLAQSRDRFAEIVQAAFELAERRSSGGRDPVAENQGLILALATIFGHPEVATLAGLERPADWQRIRDASWPVKLRGRADWTQHFLVSAALTQISTAAVSDAAGLLKEELDAMRGSGFSFADLLADRAGTRFGEIAVRSPESARAMQVALVRHAPVDQLMPSADGLPEHIDDAELQQRFGGVGGPGYQALVADIEARIARLPGFIAVGPG